MSSSSFFFLRVGYRKLISSTSAAGNAKLQGRFLFLQGSLYYSCTRRLYRERKRAAVCKGGTADQYWKEEKEEESGWIFEGQQQQQRQQHQRQQQHCSAVARPLLSLSLSPLISEEWACQFPLSSDGRTDGRRDQDPACGRPPPGAL